MKTNEYPDPWDTQLLYRVHCKTYNVAKQITGVFRNVNSIDENFKPPFACGYYQLTGLNPFKHSVMRWLPKLN